jgi:hypothetical protein
MTKNLSEEVQTVSVESHAFHANYRAPDREGPGKDGWAKCLAWLKQNGVA